mgnify:CR=1 FL=1
MKDITPEDLSFKQLLTELGKRNQLVDWSTDDILEQNVFEEVDRIEDHRRGSNFWTTTTYLHKPSGRYLTRHGLDDFEYGEGEEEEGEEEAEEE